MNISKDLQLSILAMDSYNQGYGKGYDHKKSQIGAGTFNLDDISSWISCFLIQSFQGKNFSVWRAI